MVNPVINVPSLLSLSESRPCNDDAYEFRHSVLDTSKKFGFSLSKETISKYKSPKMHRVIGIVGIESEDEFALLQDGACRQEAFFILCDPNAFDIENGWPYVSYGLSYINRRFHFIQFSSPIKIDYLVNYYVKPIAGRILRCPIVIRDEVRSYLFDKVVTSSILSAAGLLVPKEVLLAPSVRKNDHLQPLNKDENLNINMRRISAKSMRCIDINKSNEEKYLKNFLDEIDSPEGVIKPNNLGCGEGVFMFNHENLEQGEQHLKTLLSSKQDVILQEKITPPLVERQGRSLDWNLRIFVSRDENGEAIAHDMIARIGELGGPINVSVGATICLLEEIACRLNWSKQTYDEVRRLVFTTSEKAYIAICRAIADDSTDIKHNVIPDILGVDLIITRETGNWQAYIIEMDINPGGAWHLNNRLAHTASQSSEIQELNPQDLTSRTGGANRAWIDLILRRCDSHA